MALDYSGVPDVDFPSGGLGGPQAPSLEQFRRDGAAGALRRGSDITGC